MHQLVSTVTGQLAPGRDALDLVAAAFAPGSMTGAPKVRAMQLIEQLEPVRRGPYAGAFGWLAPDGSCDLAVVIRTAVVTRGRAYLHVGGAIVADSDPAEEYEESLVKARTVAGALGAVFGLGAVVVLGGCAACWPAVVGAPRRRVLGCGRRWLVLRVCRGLGVGVYVLSAGRGGSCVGGAPRGAGARLGSDPKRAPQGAVVAQSPAHRHNLGTLSGSRVG